LRVRVAACGVCHTDLHTVEGDLALPKTPLIPGHQIVGRVEALGPGAARFALGDRVGIPWLHETCGRCPRCREGNENLCASARFTGFHADGGYAELAVAPEDFVYRIPERFGDAEATPLLCGGVIGYRALRLSEARDGERLGLVGFGNSAHVTLQVARHRGCEVFVFTRASGHRRLALELGAAWAGGIEDDPGSPLDRAIVFAPAGSLVPLTLAKVRPGGTVALAGVTMSPLPAMDYARLYGERTVRSVANSTRRDVEELLAVAGEIPVRTEVETFPLAEANEVLRRMKRSELEGGAALVVRSGKRRESRT
jgi:propanol-preferring alcohol dehydrogenase